MRTIFQVLVDGELKVTFPGEIRADGTIWGITNGKATPLVNGFLVAAAGLSVSDHKKQVASGKFTAELLGCCMKLGENPGGRLVIDKTAADRQSDADYESALSPLDREKRELRREISAAERRVERCDRSQDDVEFYRLKQKAEALEQNFFTRFPEELLKEKVAAMRDRAERLRALAAGAMLYDCDGSLSREDQEERREEMLAEAQQIDAKANTLAGGK